MAKLTFQLLALLAILFVAAMVFGLVDISPALTQTSNASIPAEGISLFAEILGF
jgi:hypothetical protein